MRLGTSAHAVAAPSYACASGPPIVAAEAKADAGRADRVAPAGGIFSVLGRAMLGMAGAYLLRAVAEASLLPRPAVAAIAIVYAILWLVWAARVPAGAWFASITYACTSALILAPMLWELTLRFKVLPADGDGGRAGSVCDCGYGSGVEARCCVGFMGGKSYRGCGCTGALHCYARVDAVYCGAVADGSDLRVRGGARSGTGRSAAGGAGCRRGRLGADLYLLQPARARDRIIRRWGRLRCLRRD